MQLDTAPEQWVLSRAESALVANKKRENRIGFAALLLFYRSAGRFPTCSEEIDAELLAYLADHLGVPPRIYGDGLSRTIKRYRAEIRAFFGFREATRKDGDDLITWLCDHAVTQTRDHEQLADAIEMECRERRIEPPTRDRVGRIVRAGINAYEERFYAATVSRLSPLTRTRLDALLLSPEGQDAEDDNSSSPAAITALRADPGRASVNSMRAELTKLESIRGIGLPAGSYAFVLGQAFGTRKAPSLRDVVIIPKGTAFGKF